MTDGRLKRIQQKVVGDMLMVAFGYDSAGIDELWNPDNARI